jgi:hypothetical protein
MSNFLDDIKKVGGVAIGVAGGIALGGPLGVPGAIAAAAGALAGASDPAQDAINSAEKIGDTIGAGVFDAMMVVTETGIQLIEDAAAFLRGLIPGAIGIRPLRGSEKTLANKVFNDKVPLDRVRIVSVYGYGARPFTIPGSMLATLGWRVPAIGPLLAWTSILSGLTNTYLIFFGDDGYRDAINHQMGSVAKGNVKSFPGQTLIHELTHVWQGHYHRFAWSYVLNSLWNQCAYCASSSTAYDYAPGLQWPDYSAEQQAHIVEDWFVNTMGATQPFADMARLSYILTNIRAGSISALNPSLAPLGAPPSDTFGAVSLGLSILNAHAAAPTKSVSATIAMLNEQVRMLQIMRPPYWQFQVATLQAEIIRISRSAGLSVDAGATYQSSFRR